MVTLPDDAFTTLARALTRERTTRACIEDVMKSTGITELYLNIPTATALGEFMARHSVGLRIPTPEPLTARQLIRVCVDIGGEESPQQQLKLLGEVVEVESIVSEDALGVVRVQLGKEGWRQLLQAVTSVAWRRREDFTEQSASRRQRLQQRAFCELAKVGQRCSAVLIDASETGVFLSLAGALIEGDELRFRVQNDGGWFLGVVRWTGTKDGIAGVGLELIFDQASQRSSWLRFLGFATRRREQQALRRRRVLELVPMGA